MRGKVTTLYEKTEDKMNRIGEYKYHVVKFLENPLKETEGVSCGYVCVPKSWITWCRPEDNIVRVWYPTQDPWNTENKVKKMQKKSKQWESFLAVLKFSTDIYLAAHVHIINKKFSDQEDRTPPSAVVKEKTSKTTSSVIQNEATVEDTLDAKRWSVSSKSANTITLKRSAPADSDKTTRVIRPRVKDPGESADEVAGPSSQAFKSQTLTHKGSNETPVAKTNNRNSTEKKQIVNQNAKANHSSDPKSNVPVPIFIKCCESILELQKCLRNSLVKDLIIKAMNTDNSQSDDTVASASSDATVQTPMLNEEKRNGKQIEDNSSDDDDDDDDEDYCDDDCDHDDDINEHTKTKNNPLPFIKKVLPPKSDANDSDDNGRDEDDCHKDDSDDDDTNEHTKTKKSLPIIKEVVPSEYDGNDSEDRDEKTLTTKSPQRIKKVLDGGADDNERGKKEKSPRLLKAFVLPPEYDANDSRWTLRYREPAPGLCELVEHSGVYVDASRLSKCIKMTRCSDKLCLLLLSEVFTSRALSTCSWSGKRASGCYSQGTNIVRPGLDAHAREVLLDFLTGRASDTGRVNWRVSNRDLMTLIMSRKMVAMRPK